MWFLFVHPLCGDWNLNPPKNWFISVKVCLTSCPPPLNKGKLSDGSEVNISVSLKSKVRVSVSGILQRMCYNRCTHRCQWQSLSLRWQAISTFPRNSQTFPSVCTQFNLNGKMLLIRFSRFFPIHFFPYALSLFSYSIFRILTWSFH